MLQLLFVAVAVFLVAVLGQPLPDELYMQSYSLPGSALAVCSDRSPAKYFYRNVLGCVALHRRVLIMSCSARQIGMQKKAIRVCRNKPCT